MILGLNNEQIQQAAIDFAKKTFTYPLLLNANPVFEQYGVQGIPTTFIIDPEGKIAARHVGFSPGMEKKLEEELKKLLTAKVSSRKEVVP